MSSYFHKRGFRGDSPAFVLHIIIYFTYIRIAYYYEPCNMFALVAKKKQQQYALSIKL